MREIFGSPDEYEGLFKISDEVIMTGAQIRLRRLRPALLAGLVSVLVGGAAMVPPAVPDPGGAGADPMAALLPSRVVVHLMISGEAVRNHSEDLALLRIAQEPEVQEFLEPLLAMWGAHRELVAGTVMKITGMTMEEVERLAAGRLTLSLVDLQRRPVRSGEYAGTMLYPDLVLSYDFGAEVESLGRVLSRFEGFAESSGWGSFSDAVVAGVPVRRFDSPDLGIEAWFVVRGRRLVIATTEKTLEGVLLRAKSGDAAGSLDTLPAFRDVARRCFRPGTAFALYVDASGVTELLSRDVNEAFRVLLELSGFDAVESIGFGCDLDGAGLRDRLYFRSSEDRGLMASFRAPDDVEIRADKLLPAECGLFAGGVYNLVGSYDWMTRYLSKLDPREWEGMATMIRDLEQRLGVSLRDDLLASLGPEYAMYAAFPGQAVIPDAGLLIQVRDATRVKEILAAITEEYAGEMRIGELQSYGHRIRYLDLGSLGLRYAELPPLKPSWVFLEGYILISPWPQAAKNLLRGIALGTPRLAERSDFTALREQLRKENPQLGKAGLIYLDLKGVAGFLLANGIPLAQSLVPTDLIPLDLARLPTTEVVTRHLFGIVGGSHWTEHGGYAEYYSPTGVMLPYTLGVGALTALLYISVDTVEVTPGGMEFLEPPPPETRPKKDR